MRPPRRDRHDPRAVDIFAGAGGLTVGMKRAGFEVASAVELDAWAFGTYKANHPEVAALRQDVRTVRGRSLLAISGGTIDLLAGCPPCQGFSSLTHKNSRSDPRNLLVHEMARLVVETRPRAVMMENVPGLAMRGMPIFRSFLAQLAKLKYIVRWSVLQVADFGIPQYRRRLVLLAGKGFSIELPKPTHSRKGECGLPTWRTLRDSIRGMGPPVDLKFANENGGPQAFNWHIVRNISRENVERLKYARPGKTRAQLPQRLRPDCHKNRDRGFVNVYGRMSWDQVPVTITSGCATLSKGRFGHPDELRTISVREAARIQTFPDDYVFDCPYVEPVTSMIGNALHAASRKSSPVESSTHCIMRSGETPSERVYKASRAFRKVAIRLVSRSRFLS
jgi:DNA (cytosine-5)-methyltransferase 1